MSFFKNLKNLFESPQEKQDRLDRERRQRQAKEAAEAEGGLEFTVGMDNYDDHTEADAADAKRAAAKEAERAAAKEAERAERAEIAAALDAAREAVRAAEGMIAAEANARRRLSERIERWKTRTPENVGDDIEIPSLRNASKLEEKAFALATEYIAVLDAYEKIFANRYRNEKGLPGYFYRYPTYELWRNIPSNNILTELFYAAEIEYKKNGNVNKAREMARHKDNYHFTERWVAETGYDTRPLPPREMLCPEHLVGGKKSKYSRKSKSKYSRKPKSKYSRKTKSKYSRKSKSKYSRKH